MLFRLFLLWGLCLPVSAIAAPTILIYGDSLSAAYGIPKDQGWANLLQQRLEAQGYRHRIANASISGETSSGGLARIETTLQQTHPVLVILELGANDGLRGLPPEELHRNLGGIIEACRQRRAQVLLLGMRLPPNYGPRYTKAFAATYPQLAKAYRLPLVPFFLDGTAGHPELTQEDGLHPTSDAQPLLLENVWKVLQPLLTLPRPATRK